MDVDVETERIIRSPVATVAAYAADPANATRWYKNIRTSTLMTAPPLRLGSQIRFEARFLGKTLEYTYEVTAYEPGRRLVMRTADGPFEMETTYAWEPTADGTRMVLRNRGRPQGFSAVVAPLMARAMRRANEKDLARLAAIVEGRPRPGP